MRKMTREKQIILTARVVSMVFTPFYLPLLGLVALFSLSYLRQYEPGYKFFVLAVVYFFTILLPTLLIHAYRRYQGWTLIELGVQPLLQAESHHVVPRHTATATHQLVIDLVVAHGRVYHDAREVARQQQIAAPTYYNKRCRRRTQNFGHLLSLLLRLVFQKAVTTGLNAKGIVCQKAIVV